MSKERPPRMTPEERYAKAEANAARAERYINQLRRVKTAEAEIPGIWETGQVSQKQLALTYNISTNTVKRILQDSGLQITRHRQLKPEDRAEVANLHKASIPIEQIAIHLGVSRNTIRRVLLQSGLVEPGQRRARRSDEEYELIRAADTELRARFAGAGLYNLGMGLRQHDMKLRARAASAAADQVKAPTVPTEPSAPIPVDGVGEDPLPPISEPETTFEVPEDAPAQDEAPEPQEAAEAPVVNPETDFPTWSPDDVNEAGFTDEGPKPTPAPSPAPPPPNVGENIPPKNPDDRPAIAGPFAKAGPSDHDVSY